MQVLSPPMPIKSEEILTFDGMESAQCIHFVIPAAKWFWEIDRMGILRYNVKKESPNMGTKTSTCGYRPRAVPTGKKRIPKHGDENSFVVVTGYQNNFHVKKESPNMGTKTNE